MVQGEGKNPFYGQDLVSVRQETESGEFLLDRDNLFFLFALANHMREAVLNHQQL